MAERRMIHEDEVAREEYIDRWSKDLVGDADIPTTAGFSVGVAEYHAEEFGEIQVHDDQEAVYVVSGVGEATVGGEIIPLRPGCAFYVPPETEHATRRTGPEPVKVVYAHGAV